MEFAFEDVKYLLQFADLMLTSEIIVTYPQRNYLRVFHSALVECVWSNRIGIL